MSKIKIAGNAVVVESALKLEDIKTVKKYNANALIQMEGEGEHKEPVFVIDISNKGFGSINQNGVEFSGKTEDGNATLTITVPGTTSEIKAWIGENLTGAVMRLNQLEKTVAEVVSKIAADQKAIVDGITVG